MPYAVLIIILIIIINVECGEKYIKFSETSFIKKGGWINTMRVRMAVHTFLRIKSFLHLMVFLLILSPVFPSSVGINITTSNQRISYNLVVESINLTRIKNHMFYLSGFSSRVTGYPGCEMAAEYIRTVFESFGLKVQEQYFNVTVPVDQGSFIILPDGKIIKAFSMWPNLIQTSCTPLEGLKGPLVYVGKGELADFDGKEVENSIVLMDFDSGKNWMIAAKLGAKAAIFVETSYMSRSEAYEKMSITPINFPRLYVSRADGEYLKTLAGSRVPIKIHAEMRWQLKTAKNIIGVIEGTSLRDEIIVVSAYYDSWSITPALAPGGDETAGIASLLELADLLSRNPPERTIWLVALAGHWQFLAGAREFVEEYFFNQGKKFLFMISLDFSTDVNTLGLMYASHAYGYGGGVNLPRYTQWLIPQIWDNILPEAEKQLNKTFRGEIIQNGAIETGWNTLVPIPYYLDSEALSLANGLGIGLHTSMSFRQQWHHPRSTMDRVNLQNLIPQLEASYCIIYGLVNTKEINIDPAYILPQRTFVRLGLGSGFLTVKGQVRRYTPSLMWYTPVTSDDGQILIHIVPSGQMADPFKHIVTLANPDGSFEVHGIASVAAYGGHGATWSGLYNQMLIEAYVLCPETGNILYAPDRGPYGGSFPQILICDRHPMEVFPTVFRASTVIIFDIIDPRNLGLLGYLDPATRVTTGSVPWQIQAYDYNTWENFIFGSQILIPHEQTATLFVQPGVRFIAVLTTGVENLVSGVLTNSTAENPEGFGYLVDEPELHLTYTALRFATDLYYLSKTKLELLNRFKINDPLADLAKSQMDDKLAKAYEALRKRSYSEAYNLALGSWNWGAQCYYRVKIMNNDVNVTTIFFFILLIPFSVIIEKFIFNNRGNKRMAGIFGVFILMILIFYFFHPGMQISENAPIILGGTALLVLSTLIFSSFSQETARVFRGIREKVLGAHFIQKGGGAFYFTSFSLGVENLRKRIVRTTLTLIPLVLLAFALTSFTTITNIAFPQATKIQEAQVAYQGVLLKREYGQPGENLGEMLLNYIKTMVGSESKIAPRAWYYPPLLSYFGQTCIMGPNGTSPVLAVLGLSPEEKEIIDITGCLKGRWFMSGDNYVCIISDKAAERLGVSIGDTVGFQGIELQVVGIANSLMLDTIKDLDQRPCTPLDPRYLSGYTPESAALTAITQQYIPLSWNEILVVPYSLAVDLGAYTASIAIKINESQLIKRLTWDLSMGLYGFDIWSSCEGEISVLRRATAYQAGGFWSSLAPMVGISMLIVFTTMLGSVYERVREIKTFSSLGLSPRHAALMFLAESSVYAAISGVIGYIAGIITIHALFIFNVFPVDIYPNYTVGFVVIVVSALIGTILLSTLYPTVKASKIVTPSLERKWKITTKPKGNEWEIPLPFSAASKEEVCGILEYVNEYFRSQILERGGESFITKDTKLSLQEEKVLARVSIAPFEAGIVQEVTLQAIKYPDKYMFTLHLRRLTGIHDVWLARSRDFVDQIRKQFLTWGSLSLETKKEYIQRALKQHMLNMGD
ncbi:MAG: FtsX-like permease family protein [Thermoproteota archaeon]